MLTTSVGAEEKQWKVHDKDRPLPKEVAPGAKPGDPPSDAVVLFDGKDLSKWEIADASGGAPKWKIEGDAMTTAPRSGSIRTKQSFGDCQLHIEWKVDGKTHGNSGVFFMDQYELQIFDSYKSKQWIYADGMAGSLYGQHPPLVNACRPPGQWETFDVIFQRPRFDKDGKLLSPGRVTALQNGVLVLNHADIKGFTVHGKEAAYRPHADKMPLQLQDHGNPVSFRNIWIRPLE
ncbi:MAG: DUF1080 domain-containing protein [Phycisphaerae bacterium]|nr:DUF1080 domain-containing protein [Phycisphaerae bacterium]